MPDRVAQAYDRLTMTMNELKPWPVLSFSESAVLRYAVLKQQKLNVGANDLKIASIGLEWTATVATRNHRDFSRIPGLAIENWAA